MPSIMKIRRRTYEATDLQIESYRKKPKMNNATFLPLNDRRRFHVPDESWLKDVLWMTDLLTNTNVAWMECIASSTRCEYS